MRQQQRLVHKADQTEERLLALISAMKALLQDEDLLTLLRAEGLLDFPEQLAMRMA